MKKVLLYIWQLPQNLLGLLVIAITRAVLDTGFMDFGYFYYRSRLHNCEFGVCLGEYIIFGEESASQMSWQHEAGHRKQSRMLGPLYLLLVGLPSVVRNIWDRIMHRSWSDLHRAVWYYSGYPEHWADNLGGVSRGVVKR